MINQAVIEKKPATGTITRIMDIFQVTNPVKQAQPGIIKNYVYVDEKRIIA